LSLCFFVLLAINPFLGQGQGVEISGTVLESKSQAPIEFATVVIGNQSTKEVITGLTTDVDGKFKIVSPTEDCYVTIGFIGFVSQTLSGQEIKEAQMNLGTILLVENSQTLDEVVVRAEKSTTEFKLDKRVFNVGKDLSSTGASALELLNNVPSVNVNIEG